MNDIINDVNDLKENILKSSEYLNFKKSEKNLDNNKEVNKIITDIKKLQQKKRKNNFSSFLFYVNKSLG